MRAVDREHVAAIDRREGVEQLRNGAVLDRVNGVGRDLAERHENEGAVSQSRMGKFQARFTDSEVSHQKDI